MRPTAARMSDMPGPKVYNLWWGDKAGIRQKGIITYTLSPFRQRGNTHILRNYLFNGYRRLASQFPYFIIPFAGGYGIYTWAKSQYAWENSKEGHLALSGGGGGH